MTKRKANNRKKRREGRQDVQRTKRDERDVVKEAKKDILLSSVSGQTVAMTPFVHDCPGSGFELREKEAHFCEERQSSFFSKYVTVG